MSIGEVGYLLPMSGERGREGQVVEISGSHGRGRVSRSHVGVEGDRAPCHVTYPLTCIPYPLSPCG